MEQPYQKEDLLVENSNLTEVEALDLKHKENSVDSHELTEESKLPQSIESLKKIEVYTPAETLLEKTKFKAFLSVYSTKNNVFWVLTDATEANILYKRSGGLICKRGTDKNSQKVAQKNLESVVNAIETFKIDLLFIALRSGVRNKKHPSTSKAVEKLVSTLKLKNCVIYENLLNRTKVAISKVRMKYGRRGRRV